MYLLCVLWNRTYVVLSTPPPGHTGLGIKRWKWLMSLLNPIIHSQRVCFPSWLPWAQLVWKSWSPEGNCSLGYAAVARSGRETQSARHSARSYRGEKHDPCVCWIHKDDFLQVPTSAKYILGSTGRVLILSSLYKKRKNSHVCWFLFICSPMWKEKTGPYSLLGVDKSFPGLQGTWRCN